MSASGTSRAKVLVIATVIALAITALGEHIGVQYGLAKGLAAGYPWAPVQKIPDYSDLAWPPLMAADRNRTVHAFNSQEYNSDGDEAIFYRQWTLAQGWTVPTDILLLTSASPRPIQGVYLDTNSWFHMILFLGDQQSAAVYYTKAPAAEAGNARAWSRLRVVGTLAGPTPIAALAGSGDSDLTILYSGYGEGAGVYEIHSPDSGETWSNPVPIFLTGSEVLWPMSIRLEVDSRARTHAVWSIIDDRATGQAVFYSRFVPEQQAWLPAVILAARAEDGFSTNWPSIISLNNEVFVMYQDGATPPTKWMRRSPDGGKTWGFPSRPFAEVGEYENPILLKDSLNRLHLILGNRTLETEIHGMWHSQWNGEYWSGLTPIVSGPSSDVFDPSAPQAVVSQGNVILAAWRNDVRVKNGAWFSYTRLDSPEYPLEALPLSMPTPTPNKLLSSSGAESTPTLPRPTSAVTTDPQPENASSSKIFSNPANLILLGTAPAILLVVVAILLKSGLFRQA